MKVKTGSGRDDGEMIYRGDRREMVVVDHEDRSYMVIDQETIAELGATADDILSDTAMAKDLEYEFDKPGEPEEKLEATSADDQETTNTVDSALESDEQAEELTTHRRTIAQASITSSTAAAISR